MSGEQGPTDQVPIVQGPSDQAQDVPGPSVPKQPPFVPRVSRREVRELNATGIKLKEEMETFIAEARTARDKLASSEPATLDTVETVVADATRLCLKGPELNDPFKQYRRSTMDMLKRAELRLASMVKGKEPEEAKRITRVKGKSIQSSRKMLRETSVLYDETRKALVDLGKDALAVMDAVEQKEKAQEEERKRRVNQIVLRVLYGAGF